MQGVRLLAFAGANADIDLIGLIGMTKVMPCYRALEVELWASFSAACKARDFPVLYRHG